MYDGNSKLQNKTSKQFYCEAVTACFEYTELKISIKKQDVSFHSSYSVHTGCCFFLFVCCFVFCLVLSNTMGNFLWDMETLNGLRFSVKYIQLPATVSNKTICW